MNSKPQDFAACAEPAPPVAMLVAATTAVAAPIKARRIDLTYFLPISLRGNVSPVQ
ncbi:hypothetical protein [Nocardia abscessus]|uniref:hypothetical protein n=1 Tax=Nocardia abscessus TaxID=120957 RepID=UPI002456EAF2|nr:hypothetical protein [Nocardia abscessus]